MSDEIYRFDQQFAAATDVRFSRVDLEQKGNCLACPYTKSNPGPHHKSRCRPGEGFPNMSKLNEHIRRCHTPLHNCQGCNKRWPSKKMKEAKLLSEAHAAVCGGDGRTDGVELMSHDQQMAFETIKKIHDNGTKLEKIYTILGKSIQDIDLFFHVRDARPGAGVQSLEDIHDLPGNSIYFSDGCIDPSLLELQNTSTSDGRPSGGPQDRDSGFAGSETMDPHSNAAVDGSGMANRAIKPDRQDRDSVLRYQRHDHAAPCTHVEYRKQQVLDEDLDDDEQNLEICDVCGSC